MSDDKDDVNEDQNLALVEREHRLSISESKQKEDNIENEPENEQKEVIPSLKYNYINSEVQSIINSNPLDELKSIKEKIKNENSKIKEINSKLDELNNKHGQTVKKRKLELDYNFDTLNSKSKSKQGQNNNMLSYSSPRIKNNIYITGSDIDQIHEKMKNLRKIKIERTNLNELINIEDQYTDNRNKSISKILSDIDKGEKRIKALEEAELKFREENRKKNEYKIKLFRERELEREKERKKMINKINNISLSQANKYSPKKNYITSEEKEELRKLKEESLLQIEKEKRKQKFLPISSEELNNFSNEVKKNEKILKTELAKKKKQMEDLWKERKNLLPKYHSKFMDLNIELDKEAKEENILKKERLRNKELERANFGKEIIRNYQPKVLNDKLKLEREQRIKDLKGLNRYNNIKELGTKIKQKTSKIVQSQPKNFNKKNVFVIEETTAEKQAKKLTGKPVDYLLECRNEKSKMNSNVLMQSNSVKRMKRWKEMLDSGGKNNVYNDVENIKIQAAVMDDKANNINKLLKNGGNFGPKKEELSQEATNLYMNSIQAKIQILDKLTQNN